MSWLRAMLVVAAATCAVLLARALDPAAPATPLAQHDGYTYHGCRVYPPNDWFTTDLLRGASPYVPATVDPASSRIIANLAAAWPDANFNGSSSTYEDEIVNVATPQTPRLPVANARLLDDPYHDNSGNRIPWQDGFRSEGTAGCRYDCHTIVLDTQTCIDYETYWFGQPSWNGAVFAAGNGYVHNLNHRFDEQYARDGAAVSSGGLPMLGTTDFGEDASLPSIDHIVGLLMPGSDAGRIASAGYVAPATFAPRCASRCINALPNGARLRLHAAYACPSAVTNRQANLVCNQLKHYGAILTDVLGGGDGYALRFGLASDGSNPWREADLSALLDNLRITDFDVMTLGRVRGISL